MAANTSSAETRSIKQATFTPIVNDPRVGNDIPGFIPKKPFQKQAILSTAFNNPDIGKIILEQLVDQS